MVIIVIYSTSLVRVVRLFSESLIEKKPTVQYVIRETKHKT